MANREENLKKINAELEQLSDEELEKVAGGGFFSWPWPPSNGRPLPPNVTSADPFPSDKGRPRPQLFE